MPRTPGAADRILAALVAEGRLEIATIPARFKLGPDYATATVRKLRRDYSLAITNSSAPGKVTVGRWWLLKPSPAALARRLARKEP